MFLFDVARFISIHPQTFQSEDAVAEGIHNVVERSFIRHVEKVFVIRVAGDIFDLRNKSLGVLLPTDVMAKNLEPDVRAEKGKYSDEYRPP